MTRPEKQEQEVYISQKNSGETRENMCLLLKAKPSSWPLMLEVEIHVMKHSCWNICYSCCCYFLSGLTRLFFLIVLLRLSPPPSGASMSSLSCNRERKSLFSSCTETYMWSSICIYFIITVKNLCIFIFFIVSVLTVDASHIITNLLFKFKNTVYIQRVSSLRSSQMHRLEINLKQKHFSWYWLYNSNQCW